MRRVILGALLMSVAVFCSAQQTRTTGSSPGATNAANQALVASFDASKHLLRSGAGLIWDEHTLLCSYRMVQGAASVQIVQAQIPLDTSEVLFYSPYFDLIAFQTSESLDQKAPLGNSDALGVGDRAFTVFRKQGKWGVNTGQVKAWLDSGRGYQLVSLDNIAADSFEPSPVYNSDGEVIAWMFAPGKALPNRDLDHLLTGKDQPIPLGKLVDLTSIWKPRVLAPSSKQAPAFSYGETKLIHGTAQVPFQIEIPKNWHDELETRAEMTLARIWDDASGANLELRIIPAQSANLITAVKKTEAMMFAGFARAELTPQAGKHLSGFGANYDDPDPRADHSAVAFYAIAGKNLYVLSLTCPIAWCAKTNPIFETAVTSLQP